MKMKVEKSVHWQTQINAKLQTYNLTPNYNRIIGYFIDGLVDNLQ